MNVTVKIISVKEASNNPQHKGLLRVSVTESGKEEYQDVLFSLRDKNGVVSEGRKEFFKKLVLATKKDEATGERADFKVNLVAGNDNTMWLNPEDYSITADAVDEFLNQF